MGLKLVYKYLFLTKMNQSKVDYQILSLSSSQMIQLIQISIPYYLYYVNKFYIYRIFLTYLFLILEPKKSI